MHRLCKHKYDGSGYGCFEDDPDFSHDYTSTSEYVSMRYYQDILARLEKDPYFAKGYGNCFGKVVKQFHTKKMNLNTIDSAYWTSRLHDETFRSPSLSSLIDLSYFTTGKFSPALPESRPLSCTQVNMELDAILRQLPEMKTIANSIQFFSYQQAVADYNEAVSQLKARAEWTSPEKVDTRNVMQRSESLQIWFENLRLPNLRTPLFS